MRAFGTQLLCEQVVGRALRRQSYDINEHGLFDVEYADVLGIPFDFTAKPTLAFAELTDVYAMEEDFEAAVRVRFQAVVEQADELSAVALARSRR